MPIRRIKRLMTGQQPRPAPRHELGLDALHVEGVALAAGAPSPSVGVGPPAKPRLMPLLQLPGRPGEPTALREPSAYADHVPWLDMRLWGLQDEWRERLTRDALPLPSIDDREGYFGERHLDYWLSGLRDWALICRWCDAAGLRVDESTRVLDLGCASGRVLRHFLCQSGVTDCWGADLNRRNAAWMRKFMPACVRVLPNTTLPHLPIEDRSLDLVYGLSVINHINHLELMWLAEIRRILRPGGVCVLSFASEHAWGRMGPDVPLYLELHRRAADVVERPMTPDLFSRPMPEERVVFTYKGRDLYQCNIFHTLEYARREWSRLFEVVELVPGGFDTQDACVLRRGR